jgi:hypothetical protein
MKRAVSCKRNIGAVRLRGFRPLSFALSANQFRAAFLTRIDDILYGRVGL